MKKLRIILLFSCLVIFIRVIIITTNNLYYTHYHITDQEVIGKIISFQQLENKLSMIVQAKEKIKITYYLKENEEFHLQLGDIYYFKGEFSYFDDCRNFHLFNYQKYMRSKKIYWQLRVSAMRKIRKNKNILYWFKNNIRSRISKRKNKAYISLFILGEKIEVEEDILESYQHNGISHMFAISGMHVNLFIIILNKIFMLFFPRYKYKNVVICMMLSFYLFLANFLPSLLRSIFLYFLLLINKRYHKKFTSLELISYLFCLLLLWNPYYIYDVGFLFSFFISFCLISCKDIINTKEKYLSKLLFTSIISFIASIPLLLQNYYSINFLTPIFNCIFIPTISIIIFPLSLLSFFLPFLEMFLSISIYFLEQLSLLLEKISFLTFSFMKLPIIFFFLYYIVIFFAFYRLRRKKYFWCFILLIFLLIHYNIPFFHKNPILTMIDVGQGDSILIQLPHRQGNILIDTGGKKSNHFSISKYTLISYFKSLGIEKIDTLVLTHGDIDHLGEASYFIQHFKVKRVIMNSAKKNKLEKNLIKILNKKKIIYNTISKAKITIGNYSFDFLNQKNKKNENEDSLILYTQLNRHNILLMGDAGEESETYILKHYRIPRIDVLKVGHHGSKYSTSGIFLKEIKPKIALISCGRNNQFHHPSEEVLSRLKRQHTIYYRTDLQGMINIIFGKNLKIRTVF